MGRRIRFQNPLWWHTCSSVRLRTGRLADPRAGTPTQLPLSVSLNMNLESPQQQRRSETEDVKEIMFACCKSVSPNTHKQNAAFIPAFALSALYELAQPFMRGRGLRVPTRCHLCSNLVCLTLLAFRSAVACSSCSGRAPPAWLVLPHVWNSQSLCSDNVNALNC